MSRQSVQLDPQQLFKWAERMAMNLAVAAGDRPVRLLYVPRGGFVPAYILAQALWGKAPAATPEPLSNDVSGDQEYLYVVVDDVIDSGRTLRQTLGGMKAAGLDVTFIAPVCKGDWSDETDLTLCGAEARYPQDTWVVFPWELNWED